MSTITQLHAEVEFVDKIEGLMERGKEALYEGRFAALAEILDEMNMRVLGHQVEPLGPCAECATHHDIGVGCAA